MRPAGCYTDDSSDEFDDCYYSNVVEAPKPELTEKDKQEQIRQDVYRLSSINHTAPIIDYLNEGFDVNTILPDGWTLLIFAATFGNFSFTKELISRGADIKLHRNTVTPLMAACSCSHQNNPQQESIETIKLLLDSGADPNVCDNRRVTPLMCAASYGNLPAIKLLLDICKKDDIDNQGWDALFWAVCSNHVETCQLLLDNGFNGKTIDVRGCTCLDYAIQYDFHDIIKVLPQAENNYEYYINENSQYIFQEELYEQTFLRDVILMLKSCDSPNFIETFVDSNINLKRFLTLTREDLIGFGILKPYQQDRILGALFKFHKYPYLPKSINYLKKGEAQTTVNVGISIITSLRHLVVMESAVKYLRLNLKDLTNTNLVNDIDRICRKLKSLERTVTALGRRIQTWEKDNEQVDFICSRSDKRWNSRKWLFLSLALAAPLMYTIKKVYL
ncbi:PREDICTED: ankyrin repeat, SAM and basic leucine zipper domain-containing protein 1 [Nicrophorus vespilloides]|uniref:Ankyrin repeat, SAM and basic leucine zipper domain-containing protein 1 n=1 Tax=Nicrophorus vespilloides TaxID=110193 RepID=A0ABM1M445_NICVS|nr:PREDICTED: ankyrin repeat, SAM and basic leucine zipper domain-containing protein 1 [Nicrophorus vespilloides]